MRTVVIYVGGEGPTKFPAFEGEVLATIAADSGLHLADAHGVKVDLVVGDMDSVNPELLNRFENAGTIISRFPHEKDETDFELSVMAARNYNAEKIVVIGGDGGRIDHLLANLFVLSGSLTENYSVEAFLKGSIIKICRPTHPVNFMGAPGDEVSLIPVNRDASGVTTSGLKWELNEALLRVSESRGVSNIQTGNEFNVSCTEGSIAVIKII